MRTEFRRFVATLVLTGVMAAPAAAGRLSVCERGKDAKAMAACTALIEHSGTSHRTRNRALLSRARHHFDAGDFAPRHCRSRPPRPPDAQKRQRLQRARQCLLWPVALPRGHRRLSPRQHAQAPRSGDLVQSRHRAVEDRRLRWRHRRFHPRLAVAPWQSRRSGRPRLGALQTGPLPGRHRRLSTSPSRSIAAMWPASTTGRWPAMPSTSTPPPSPTSPPP